MMRCYKCMEEISDARFCPHCGHEQIPEPENKQYLAPGTVLGGVYTIGTVIGSGGFGVTYIGWDEKLDRKIAVKEYFPGSLSTRIPGQTLITAFSGEKQRIFNHGKERFIEEARLLMRFSGEDGIVSVYDVLEENGTVYMVMGYVPGVTLRQSIADSGPIPEDRLLGFMIPMLLSLKFVHNAGYIHRDISPDNIMCLPDGSVRLLDFGAARYSVMEESQSLSVIVKQGYTPIEQYQSHGKQGPWTDLYAVAATMYTALTGIVPEESLERMAKDTLKKPSSCGVSVSESTENAVMAALNIRPEDRPQSIDEFLEILTGKKKGGLVTAKKNKKKIAAIAAAAAAVLLGGILVTAAILTSGGGFGRSKGIEVPDAVNKLEAEAQELFAEHSLGMTVTGGRLYDAEMIDQGYIVENLVVEQNPASGTSVEADSMVGVILSKGKKKICVPSVTDQLQETALTDFEENGFGEDFTIEIREEYSDTNMPGTVISQDIPEDSAVDFDGKIVLTISCGRKTPLDEVQVIKAGDYRGREFAELKEELLESGIYLVKSASVYSADYPFGTVISQSPEEGTELRSGGAVYVVTSLGLETAQVPDIRYMDKESAKKALLESGLSWKIQYVINPDFATGLVTEQKTAPGSKVDFGTEIEFCVSAEEEGTEVREEIELTLDPVTLSLAVDETAQFTCSYDGDVLWAVSNPYIAEIDDSGLLTAKHFGAATVIASAEGNITTASIMVTDESVFTVTDAYEIVEGDVVSLSSSIPESILSSVVWRSSSPEVASVDQEGTVTALKPGCTSVTAAYRNRIAECCITVAAKKEYLRISRRLLTGDTETAVQTLENLELDYALEDVYSDTVAEGRVSDIVYDGYIDNNHYYIAVGSKVVLSRSLGENYVASVAVATPPEKTVYFAGEFPDLTGLVLTATYADGTVRDVTEGYTASEDPLTSVGEQELEISYEGQSAMLKLTVKPVDVQSVRVSPTSVSLYVGDSSYLSVRFEPANATYQDVTVSVSDTSVVRASGLKLTGLKPGSATVTVTSHNGKTASCSVSVVRREVASITLNKSEYTMKLGAVADFTATVLPENATDKTLTWSSSHPSIVSVDSKGGFKGLATGTSVITARASNGVTASCTVTVITDKSLTIKTMPKNTTFCVGDTVTPEKLTGLTLTYKDENGTATDVTSGYTLSCTTIYEGSSKVNVTYKGIIVSFPVTIKKPYVTVSKTSTGYGVKLTATTFPENQPVTWTSSNTSIFYFRNGYIVAVSSGTAYARATMTYNGIEYYDECPLTVALIEIPQTEERTETTEYSFKIVRTNDSYGEYGRYTISTNIPGFTVDNVAWSGGSGSVDQGYYIVDESPYRSGGSYTVTATYTYQGQTLTAQYTCNVEQWEDWGD